MRGGSGASVHALAERPPGRWEDLRKRVFSALVLAPIALACVWVGGIAFILIVAALMAGLTVEWLGLCRQSPVASAAARRFRLCRLAGVAIAVAAARSRCGPSQCAVPAARRLGERHRRLSGRALDRRTAPGAAHLARQDLVGAVGGLLAAVAAGLLRWLTVLAGAVTWRTAAIAAFLAIVAQAGDLLESFVKRRLEVKDSGHLIPGHGGLFDRLDGVLAAAPVAALLALTLGRGVVCGNDPDTAQRHRSRQHRQRRHPDGRTARRQTRALRGPRPGRRPQRRAAGRAGDRLAGRAGGDRRSRLLRRAAPGAGGHRHRHRRRARGGGRGRRPAGRLDHGRDHRRRRPRRHARRDPPRRRAWRWPTRRRWSAPAR